MASPYRVRPLMSGDEFLKFAQSVADLYRVEQELGRGGWGVVYAARDLRHDRPVAIKLLRREYAGSLSSERFRREIGILSRLDHPNIVSLFDSGEFDGAPWYAMSFVAGETLQRRIEREKQLSIPDSIRIAKAIAEALAHAHAANVVHRDIKPANILLSPDRVRVVDFGIARAFTTSASSQGLTSSGVQIGTLSYMSPEQAAGQGDVDRRSDIYALGCVLYEMIAGEPPFSGVTPATVVARHVLDPVPNLRTVRSSVPPALEDVVYKALSKSPADRYQSANEMVAALSAAELEPEVSVSTESRRRKQFAKRRVLTAGAVAVLGLGAWGAWTAKAREEDASAVAAADTNRIVLFPLTGEGTAAKNGDRLFREAALKWRGPILVDQGAVSAYLGDDGSVSSSDARRAALALNARRYIRADLGRGGDGLKVHAQLFDAGYQDAPIAEAIENAIGESALPAAIGRAVDALLLRSPIAGGESSKSVSLAAQQAYLRGMFSVEKWNLPAADSAFAAAIQFDQHFASAALRLALTRDWLDKDIATWSFAHTIASVNASSLSKSESEIAAALAARLHGDAVAACTAWDSITTRRPKEFDGWYGAALCLQRDRTVLADFASPSGWRFRTGMHSAVQRFSRAFALRPSVLAVLEENNFDRVYDLLWTSTVQVRAGVGKEGLYAAMPSLLNDTLAFIPYTYAVFGSTDTAALQRMPRTVGAAVQRQREMFRSIATTWHTSQPSSASAVHAVALSMFLLGDPGAMDTLASAERLLKTPVDSQRIHAALIWMRVQTAIPSDTAVLRRVRDDAERMIRDNAESKVDRHVLASLAALVGKVDLAEHIEQRAAVDVLRGNNAMLNRLAKSLEVRSAFGAPVESVTATARRVEREIALLPAQQQAGMRMMTLNRPARLSLPAIQLFTTTELSKSSDYLLAAFGALRSGDTIAATQRLAQLATVRAMQGTELQFDAALAEARLLTSAGDSKAATIVLSAALETLGRAASVQTPIQAASLVNAAALRASLAAQQGDSVTAAKWARVTAILWAHADTPLQPTVQRMTQLMK